MELFRVEGSQRLAEVRRALSIGDAHGVASAAHRLKGSVGTLKATRSFEAAGIVEALARRGELDAAHGACAALEVEIARLQYALNTFAGVA